MSKETTTVTKTELSSQELNELLDIPGADAAISSEEEGKPGFFKQGAVDMSFLTKKAPEKSTEKTDNEAIEEDKPKSEVDAIIDETIPDPEKVQEDTTKGRPKVSKDGAIELTKKLIEKKLLVPFDDDKAIEDYTLADLEELYDANIKDKEEKVEKELPARFMASVPDQLKYAAKYINDGGTDIAGLFRALGEVEQVRELSSENPKDHETIAREYLSITNFGDSDDIESQITEWKDLNKLAEKVEKFKPKLDRMREEQVAQRLQRQEEVTRQRAEAAKQYTAAVYDTLKSSEINGIKLDKKTQGMLYTGLTQSQYPSISGRPTNLLGYLLEKHQIVEPNHALIAEALWLLSDPEDYKAKLKAQAKNETTEKIVRQLKTEEGKKIGSSSQEEREEGSQRKLPRTSNFFKR